MNAEERQRDVYIQGAYEPAPAVISINGTVTSIAMTMFLAMMVGVPSDGRHILYNARTPSLRTVSFTRNPNCYICSPRGVLAEETRSPCSRGTIEMAIREFSSEGTPRAKIAFVGDLPRVLRGL